MSYIRDFIMLLQGLYAQDSAGRGSEMLLCSSNMHMVQTPRLNSAPKEGHQSVYMIAGDIRRAQR